MSQCFVVLNHPQGHPMPVVDTDEHGEDEVVHLFASFAEAERAMDKHTFAQAWGYEIYPWPKENA
jgi:hypothetical protein